MNHCFNIFDGPDFFNSLGYKYHNPRRLDNARYWG